MSRPPPIAITVRDGLGGRVASIANALSHGRRVVFGWAVNEHCPLTHREVFPDGIPGVAFSEAHGECGFTPWNGRPYFDWDAADCRPTANQAYGRIMEAMTGRARDAGYHLGVCVRFFRRPRSTLDGIASHIAATARAIPATRVFLLADSRRAELAAALSPRLPGITIHLPVCRELDADLDRQPEDTLDFIFDWKTLLACPVIAAPDGPTTILHPARAAGTPIHYPPA